MDQESVAENNDNPSAPSLANIQFVKRKVLYKKRFKSTREYFFRLFFSGSYYFTHLIALNTLKFSKKQFNFRKKHIVGPRNI